MPSTVIAGGTAFALTVNGSGFNSASAVNWNGAARTTTSVNSSQLTASITATDIASAGTAQVTVVNPSASGGTSNPLWLAINNPAPTVTSLSPASAVAGDGGITLAVDGTGFNSSSSVQWNGTDRTTTFVSSTRVSAAIPATDLAAAGTANVRVVNPAPGGGASTAVTFTIGDRNPVPAITSLSPDSVTAGGDAFTLTVNGTGFESGATVQWNGAGRVTTFVSSTQLTAFIPADDITSPGAINITVVNRGGGVSAAQVFTINPAPSTPVISSLSPNWIVTGTAAFTLTVKGSGFVSGSIVQWNGTSRTTTFIDSTQLTASIPASDRVLAGTAKVTVVNPGPNSLTSVPANFTISAAVTGVTERLSLATDGTQANGPSSYPVITPDGRFVAFESGASNLVPGDTNGVTDIFLRDTCRGATKECTPTNIRVSVATDGTEANDNSNGLNNLAVTPDGRYVAFQSRASNLVLNDTNNDYDVFVRDTCIGAPAACTPSTSIVSVGFDGTPGNRGSDYPAISAEGRYIAFESYATNLSPGISGPAVYVRDTCAGVPACTPSTKLVSAKPDGTLIRGLRPSMSDNGRYVAFDYNSQVYINDTCAGASAECVATLTLVSANADNSPAAGANYSASVSADGRYVAYVSQSGDGAAQVTVRDTCLAAVGECAPSTLVASLSNDGSPANGSVLETPAISPDGRFVSFESMATNLVAGDTNNAADVFVRDTCIGGPAGCVPSTVRVSVSANTGQMTGLVFVSRYAITLNGQSVVFSSPASSLTSGDNNNVDDVFLAITPYR